MALVLKDVNVNSEGKQVVENVSISVEAGQVLAILGSNGAGKSELVLGVAGVLSVTKGTIVVDDKDITGQSPNVIRLAGVAAVPEGHRVLTRLTVDENLRAAGALLQSGLAVRLTKTYELFPELAERKSQLAGTLSGGQQQMVAIGHSLMCEPKYLLIDEMSLGLAPVIVQRLMGIVEELKNDGVGIVLIEQFTELALGIADNAIVLRNGTMSYSGIASTLLDDTTLLDEAYFGTGHQQLATEPS